MDVGPGAGIVGDVPAGMVRVVIDDDRIRGPEPVIDVRVVERGDGKVGAVEPEALAITALKVKNVAGSEAEREAAVFEGVLEVEAAGVAIIAIVADPAAIGVDMRSVRVAGGIAKVAVPLVLATAFLRGSALSLGGGSHGRAVGRDVSSTDASAMLFMSAVLFVAAAAILRGGGDQQSERESNRETKQCLHK